MLQRWAPRQVPRAHVLQNACAGGEWSERRGASPLQTDQIHQLASQLQYHTHEGSGNPRVSADQPTRLRFVHGEAGGSSSRRACPAIRARPSPVPTQPCAGAFVNSCDEVVRYKISHKNGLLGGSQNGIKVLRCWLVIPTLVTRSPKVRFPADCPATPCLHDERLLYSRISTMYSTTLETLDGDHARHRPHGFTQSVPRSRDWIPPRHPGHRPALWDPHQSNLSLLSSVRKR